MFDLIRDAAVGWDGKDPVRPFPDLSQAVTAVDDATASTAVYLIETPLDPAQRRRRAGGRAVERHLRCACRARPTSCARAAAPRSRRSRSSSRPRRRACRNAWLERQGRAGPYRRARVTRVVSRRQHRHQPARRSPPRSRATSTTSARRPACELDVADAAAGLPRTVRRCRARASPARARSPACMAGRCSAPSSSRMSG